MFLSQDKLIKLSEEELRNKVLIPLFEAMDFRDVIEYHGSDEFGKDIVMWQGDVLRRRINFAVVAKAKKISGAVAKGSLAEISLQIKQCFGEPYMDPVSLTQQRVDRVIVVTSGSITRPARRAMQIELEASGLASRTDVIDGDILWSRVREYMPNAVIWDNLDKARKMLNEQDGDYDVTLQVSRDMASVLVAPRNETTESVDFSLGLQFAETIEGLAKRAEFLNSLRTGQPVLLTKESVDKIEVTLPEFLANLGREGEITHLYKGPARVHPPMLRRLVAEGREGTLAIFEYIDFTHQQGGTEQVTFSNKGQSIPFRFELTIEKGTSKINFRFSSELTGSNVVQRLRALLFLKALSEGAEVHLLDWESELPELKFKVAPGVYAEPNPLELHCFSALAFIQGRLGKAFTVQAISGDQASIILFTATVLQTGRVVLPEATLGLEDPEVTSGQGAWDELLGKPFAVHVRMENYTITILDQEVPLGPALWLYQGIVAEEVIDGTRKFFLRASPESPFLAEFADWLNPEGVVREESKEGG